MKAYIIEYGQVNMPLKCSSDWIFAWGKTYEYTDILQWRNMISPEFNKHQQAGLEQFTESSIPW